MPGYWGIDLVTSTVSEPRHEIKLVVAHGNPAQVQMWLRLHPANFSSTYPQRRVNNVYFDTADLTNVEANLAGISERRKLRLRWYDQTSEIVQGTWEIKSKQAGLSWKITQPIAHTISLSAMSWQEILVLLHTNNSSSIDIHLVHLPLPTLINHYERLYFASWDGSIRATVDYHQTFYDQRLSARPNFTRPLPTPDNVILELKAPQACYDQLAGVVQQLPVRVARNSKYVNGMRYATSL